MRVIKKVSLSICPVHNRSISGISFKLKKDISFSNPGTDEAGDLVC